VSEQIDRAPSQPAEPAWRPPRTKARTPPPAAYPGDEEDFASAYQDDRKPPRERVAPQALDPVPSRASEGRRAAAPPREDYSGYERAGVETSELLDYRNLYDEQGAAAAEAAGEPVYDDYDYGGREYEASYRPGGRKLWLAAALLLLAVVGTAGAYSLRAILDTPSSEAAAPPVIRADSAPKKIAASQPDKQIQDRLGDRGAGERLVPREEQPVTIKDPGASALPPVGRPTEPPPVVTAPATTAATVVRPPGSQPAPAAPAAEPKRIKTVTIRPEGQQEDAAPPPAASSARTTAPAPAAPPPPARVVRPATPVAPGGEPMSITPQAAPAPSPRSQTALAAPPPPRANAGDYVVQLSAQKSESDAQASFRAMQAKYPSVLSGRQPLIRRKDLGAKGVYFGAQVGPFASQSEASQLCEQLKAAGGTCIVQRN
jgi:hypothetical protein